LRKPPFGGETPPSQPAKRQRSDRDACGTLSQDHWGRTFEHRSWIDQAFR